MKVLLYLPTLLLLSCLQFQSFAQLQERYFIYIMNQDGKPLTNAKILSPSGEEIYTKSDGKVIYYGQTDWVKKDGKYVKKKVLPYSVKVTAANYQDQTIVFHNYPTGSVINIKLQRNDPEYHIINVYVKNKKGTPLPGAYILVNPGKSTSSDGSGYAQAMHKQIIGEWVTIRVSVDGYKTQEQHIPTGDATRMEGNKVIPAATAYFTMEPGTNEAAIFQINVEVLDTDTDQPVPGAGVELEVSDGTLQMGSTNAQGEVKFKDMEYSFQGTTAKVKVKKPGYEEKWSDITSDLMTGKDNSERQFVVYIKKKPTDAGNWNGYYSDGVSTMAVSASASSFFASWTYTAGDSKGQGTLKSTKIEGNKVTGTWTAAHDDLTKSGSRSGTFTITLDGKSISGQLKEDAPKWNYKPGFSSDNVQSSMYKGAVWPLNLKKK